MQFLKGKRSRWNDAIVAIIISVSVIIFSILMKCIYYNQPDDYLMNHIASGSFGNGFDSYLIFINIIFGKIISFLFNIVPNFNWFGTMYVASIGFVFFSLYYLFLDKREKYLSIVLLIVLEFGTMVFLTFTVIAYIAMGAFCVYVIDMSFDKKKSTKKIIISLILLVIGLGLRTGRSVALSTVVVFMPIYIVEFKKLNIKKFKYLTGLFFVVGILITKYNSISYAKSDLWINYQTFNVARSSVLDNPPIEYEEKKENLQKLGISENDLKCINQWIFADKEVYSLETIEQLGNVHTFVEKRMCNPIKLMKSMFLQKYNYIFAIAVSLFIICMNSKKKLGIVFIALTTYGLIALLYFRNRPVERVMIPIYFVGVLAMLIYAFNATDKYEMKNIYMVKVVVGVVSAIIIAFFIHKATNNNKYQVFVQNKYQNVWEYIRENEEYMFVGTSSTLNEMIGFSKIFDVGEDITLKNVMKLGSWDIYSTRYNYQVERYNFSYKERLLISLVLDENIIYITNNQSYPQIELIKNYVKEHIGKDINMNLIKNFESSDISFYKLYIDN